MPWRYFEPLSSEVRIGVWTANNNRARGGIAATETQRIHTRFMQNQLIRPCGIRALLLVALGAALLAGCRTPDLKPFRDSTARIQNSVAEAQDLYTDELERLRPFVPDGHALTIQQRVFATNWQARTEVMDAMVRYAASLAAVADAPEQSRAGMETVARSINELGVAAGPYQQAIQGTTEIALELVDLANRVRAARQLKRAVQATDPEMQKLAVLLAQDFGALRRSLELNQRSIKNLMDGPLSRQLEARALVESKMAEKARSLQSNAGGADWETAVARYNQETAEARKYLADTEPWYLPHTARVEAAQKQMGDRIRLLRDTEAALRQWARAHANLAVALQHNGAPDWTLLRLSAERIDKSINKIAREEAKP